MKFFIVVIFIFVVIAIASPQPIQSVEYGPIGKMIPVTSTLSPDLDSTSCKGEYTLRKSKELPEIARRCSITVSEIYLANKDLAVEDYKAGVTIQLPGQGGFPGPAPDSCTGSDCGRLTTSSNDTVFNYPDTFPYRVRKGESLTDIAARFDTTEDVIHLLNPKIKGDRLIEGQYITLPGK